MLLGSHCEERSDEAIFGEYGMRLEDEIATACGASLAMTHEEKGRPRGDYKGEVIL